MKNLLQKHVPKAIIPVFFILTLAISAYAQKKNCTASCSCHVTGKVVDQITKEPLPFASIQVKNTNIGAYSNEQGIFHLENLCTDEFDLMVSFVGYKPVTHHHDIYHQALVIYLSPSDLQLESIVVEGKKTETGLISSTETTLGPKELEAATGSKLGEVMTKLPGVSTLKTGQNLVKPVVHGLHSNRVLIINNGIRHEGQNWGIEHAPEIDPSMANNITLVKGASSIKYGPGALGGVIIINPPQPLLSSQLGGNVDLNLRSNGRAVGGSALLQQGYSRFAWIAQASGLFQGDLQTPDYMLTNTGAQEYSFSFSSLYHKKNLDLKLYYSMFDQKLGILRGSVIGSSNDFANAIKREPPAGTEAFSYEIDNPHQEVNHQLIKINGAYNLKHGSLTFQYGLQINKRKEFDVRRGSNTNRPIMDLELTTHTLDADWNHPTLGIWNGSAGIQFMYQDNNNLPGTNTIPFLPNFNHTNIGAYMAESTELGNITLDAALRFDAMFASARGRNTSNDIFSNTFDYQNITGTVGVFVPLNVASSFRSSLGSAWRPPNMSELYSFGKHQVSYEYGLWRYYQGEAGIFSSKERPVQSESSFKWVNTYTYQKNNLSFELTGYANYLKNFIYMKPGGVTLTVSGPALFFIYDQTDAFLAGFDGSFMMEHSKNWESDFKFMLLYSKDTENNTHFVGMPPAKASYAVGFKKDKLSFLKYFSTGMEASYTFEQLLAPPTLSIERITTPSDSDVNNLENKSFDFMTAPGDYLLLNYYTRFSYGKFSYNFQIKNLLNTEYRDYTNRIRYFADEIGRNFIFSAKYSF